MKLKRVDSPGEITQLLSSSSAMAVLNVCLGHSNPILLRHNKKPFYSESPISSSTAVPRAASSLQPRQREDRGDSIRKEKVVVCSSKRRLSLSVVALIVYTSLPSSDKAMTEGLELERYTDSKEGFTLLRPSSYVKVDKAGATVLFEEANKGSNNVGVVVSPVRLTTLKEFGSPQFVADKLIQAEKRKESTRDAEVIAVAERSGQGGLQVYEFEYKVDSTRGGMKRIFSAAFVASKKLYLLNIAQSDKPESPLDTHTRMMLEQVLHSFDTASLT